MRARQAMAWPLVQVVDLVAGDVDGRSAEAATMVRRSLERVVRRTDIAGVCGGLPRPTAALQSVALKATSEPVGIHRLARRERAFTTWSEATGGKSTMRGAVEEVRHCRAVDDYFRVGYELWWDHAPYGRRWWMVLAFDNDTERSPLLTLGGSLKATHVVEPSSWGQVGNAHLFRWGGSSADYAEAPPGHSTKLVGVSGRPEVRTTEEGRLFDIRPPVYLRSGGVNCSLPVPRLN